MIFTLTRYYFYEYNICNLNTTYLDLDIIIEDGRFVSKLYDKRRDFVFKVITFPNLRSNIPNKTSYGTFIGEIFRILYVNHLLNNLILLMMLNY